MAITFISKKSDGVTNPVPSEPTNNAHVINLPIKQSSQGVPKTALVIDPISVYREMLTMLDPYCKYKQWFEIACATKAAGLSFQDFDNWSKKGGHKYNAAACKTLWDSTNADGGITAGTLVYLAKEAGYTGPVPTAHSASQGTAGQPVAADGAAALTDVKANGTGLENRFNAWPDAPAGHPYLAKKKILPKGLKIATGSLGGKDVTGWAAVPVRKLDGTFCTVHFLSPSGEKWSAPGKGSFSDGMHVIGTIAPDCVVYLAEGLASAWSIYNADPSGAAVTTFSAGRFGTVATALRTACPDAKLVLVPDKGAEGTAHKVAAEVGGYLVEMPEDAPSNYDAWDVEDKGGRIALQTLLTGLKKPEPKTPKPEPLQDYEHLIDWSDTGNANLFSELTAGDLRFVTELGKWIYWDGSRWLVDNDGGIAQKHALRVAEHYRNKAKVFRSASTKASSDDRRKQLEKRADSYERWSVQCRNKSRLTALLGIAGKFQHVALPMKRLDADHQLFGVANGVVDLRTGTLREAARDDFVTKRSPVPFIPGAAAPKWVQFIEQITGSPIPPQIDAKGDVIPETVGQFKPRPSLANYLRRALGYSLTGLTDQHKLFVCVGGGSNGKNVLLDMERWVLGDYGVSLPSTMLLDTKYADDAEKASPNTARLAGARCAISSENKEGQKFAVATIKRHTGDKTMTARFLHGNPFEFEISHKLWMMTNAAPAIDHLDPAIKGRLHFIPFDRQWNRPGEADRDPMLPDGDERLLDELKKEGSGILAWLVAGAVEYEKNRLVPPPEVANMTRSYFSEQDVFSMWLTHYERCDPKEGTAAKSLLEAILAWCADEGIDGGKYNATSFSKALASRHVEKHKSKQGILYGLRLLPDGVPDIIPDAETADEVVDYSGML